MTTMTPSRDAGVSLVEVAVSGFFAIVLGVLAMGWLSAGAKESSFSRSQDDALTQVRTVRQELDRELRFARSVVSGTANQIVVWMDTDRDAVQDAGETVTWRFTTDGKLTRGTDTVAAVTRASGLVYASSSFSYAPSSPPSATSVTIQITVAASKGMAPSFGDRVSVSSVRLRNL